MDLLNASDARIRHFLEHATYANDMPGLESDLLDAWGNGSVDESEGNTDYGPGHFLRVGNFILRTDSHGFTYLIVFGQHMNAIEHMELIRHEYEVLDSMSEEAV